MVQVTRRAALQGAALLACAAATRLARAQANWPARPVTLVVPFAAGGSNDVSARLLAPKLQTLLGQSFVVDNRSGGGGSIGTQAVGRAQPDGYMALVSAASNHVMHPLVARHTGTGPRETLAGVSTLTDVPLVLAVPASLNIGTLPELLALLRREPGKHSFGSSGVGSSHHLAGELFTQKAELDMAHVPYRGGGPALSALMSGEVTMAFLNLPTILPQAQSGTLRILGLAELSRSALEPDIPTMSEVGLPDFAVASWCAIFVPRRTPGPVIARFNAAIREAVADEDLRARFLALGVDPRVSSPEELDQIVARDFAFWGPVIRSANITF